MSKTKDDAKDATRQPIQAKPKTGTALAPQLRAPRSEEAAAITEAKARVAKMLPRAMVHTRDGEDGALQITRSQADGEGWSAQLQSAFGSPSKEFLPPSMAKLFKVICPAGKPLDQDTV